jgi:hypothetical protein
MAKLSINNQEPVTLGSQATVLLSCRITGGALEVVYEGQPESVRRLEIILYDGERAQVKIADFAHEGVRYRINAFIVSGGDLVPWTREDSAARYDEIPAPEAEQRIPVQVRALGYEFIEPISGREEADYQFATADADPIDIIVPKKGSKPD